MRHDKDYRPYLHDILDAIMRIKRIEVVGEDYVIW